VKEVVMADKVLREGAAWLATGLFCTSVSSLLERFAGTAPAANWAQGFLDGLAAVAFGAAIYFLARQARPSSGR
jgi:hypothetical protein